MFLRCAQDDKRGVALLREKNIGCKHLREAPRTVIPGAAKDLPPAVILRPALLAQTSQGIGRRTLNWLFFGTLLICGKPDRKAAK